jgi:hypothetical protein
MSAPALGGQSGNPISRDRREGRYGIHKPRSSWENTEEAVAQPRGHGGELTRVKGLSMKSNVVHDNSRDTSPGAIVDGKVDTSAFTERCVVVNLHVR